MSVGHVARAVEEMGVPTVGIYVSAFRHVPVDMKLPRTLVTRHPFGRPVGPAGDAARQTQVVAAALDLLETASSGATIADMPGRFGSG